MYVVELFLRILIFKFGKSPVNYGLGDRFAETTAYLI